MKTSESLNAFIKESAASGHDQVRIGAALQEAGWSEREVSDALEGWVETRQGLLAPRPRPVVSARDFLFYGVLFGTLFLSGIYTVLLGFAGIDLWIGDENSEWLYRRFRTFVAAVVVFAPVFLWLNRIDQKERAKDPARHRSAIRKWLAAVLLLIAAVTFLGDLVWVISRMLNGDLLLETLLKGLVVGIVSGGALLVYRGELVRAP